MKQYSYVDADGSFDYQRYRMAQIGANKQKLGSQWVREPVIAYLARYLAATVGPMSFGLCHGTRRGAEQAWFARHLGCRVLGTEISDTATQFADTIQWDFHEVKPEWHGAVDFIYSNSWDHSYDPVKLFGAWMSCVRPGGAMILEHTPSHTYADEMDPLGMSLDELVGMLDEIGAGRWGVAEVLADGPVTGLHGHEARAVHVVVRHRDAAARRRPFLGICAIVKNEGPYIHEWLAYHRAIGVERFTIYHNASTDNTLEEIRRFPYPVDIIDWPGEAPQVRAYRDMLAERRHYAEWCAFIDVDEFLTPRAERSVADILRAQPPEVGTLYVHWLFFGSSGHAERRPGLVTERFQHRAPVGFGPNRYGKSIVRMSGRPELESPHVIAGALRAVNTRGEDISRGDRGRQEAACHEEVALHHYFTKSVEEWTRRRALGRPALPLNHPDAIRGMDQFRAHDRNEELDRTAAEVMARAQAQFAPAVGGAAVMRAQDGMYAAQY